MSQKGLKLNTSIKDRSDRSLAEGDGQIKSARHVSPSKRESIRLSRSSTFQDPPALLSQRSAKSEAVQSRRESRQVKHHEVSQREMLDGAEFPLSCRSPRGSLKPLSSRGKKQLRRLRSAQDALESEATFNLEKTGRDPFSTSASPTLKHGHKSFSIEPRKDSFSASPSLKNRKGSFSTRSRKESFSGASASPTLEHRKESFSRSRKKSLSPRNAMLEPLSPTLNFTKSAPQMVFDDADMKNEDDSSLKPLSDRRGSAKALKPIKPRSSKNWKTPEIDRFLSDVRMAQEEESPDFPSHKADDRKYSHLSMDRSMESYRSDLMGSFDTPYHSSGESCTEKGPRPVLELTETFKNTTLSYSYTTNSNSNPECMESWMNSNNNTLLAENSTSASYQYSPHTIQTRSSLNALELSPHLRPMRLETEQSALVGVGLVDDFDLGVEPYFFESNAESHQSPKEDGSLTKEAEDWETSKPKDKARKKPLDAKVILEEGTCMLVEDNEYSAKFQQQTATEPHKQILKEHQNPTQDQNRTEFSTKQQLSARKRVPTFKSIGSNPSCGAQGSSKGAQKAEPESLSKILGSSPSLEGGRSRVGSNATRLRPSHSNPSSAKGQGSRMTPKTPKPTPPPLRKASSSPNLTDRDSTFNIMMKNLPLSVSRVEGRSRVNSAFSSRGNSPGRFDLNSVMSGSANGKCLTARSSSGGSNGKCLTARSSKCLTARSRTTSQKAFNAKVNEDPSQKQSLMPQIALKLGKRGKAGSNEGVPLTGRSRVSNTSKVSIVDMDLSNEWGKFRTANLSDTLSSLDSSSSNYSTLTTQLTTQLGDSMKPAQAGRKRHTNLYRDQILHSETLPNKQAEKPLFPEDTGMSSFGFFSLSLDPSDLSSSANSPARSPPRPKLPPRHMGSINSPEVIRTKMLDSKELKSSGSFSSRNLADDESSVMSMNVGIPANMLEFHHPNIAKSPVPILKNFFGAVNGTSAKQRAPKILTTGRKKNGSVDNFKLSEAQDGKIMLLMTTNGNANVPTKVEENTDMEVLTSRKPGAPASTLIVRNVPGSSRPQLLTARGSTSGKVSVASDGSPLKTSRRPRQRSLSELGQEHEDTEQMEPKASARPITDIDSAATHLKKEDVTVGNQNQGFVLLTSRNGDSPPKILSSRDTPEYFTPPTDQTQEPLTTARQTRQRLHSSSSGVEEQKGEPPSPQPIQSQTVEIAQNRSSSAALKQSPYVLKTHRSEAPQIMATGRQSNKQALLVDTGTPLATSRTARRRNLSMDVDDGEEEKKVDQPNRTPAKPITSRDYIKSDSKPPEPVKEAPFIATCSGQEGFQIFTARSYSQRLLQSARSMRDMISRPLQTARTRRDRVTSSLTNDTDFEGAENGEKTKASPVNCKGSSSEINMHLTTGNVEKSSKRHQFILSSRGQDCQLITARGGNDGKQDIPLAVETSLQTERVNRDRVESSASMTNDEEEHMEVQSPSPITERVEPTQERVVLPHTARSCMVTRQFAVKKDKETGSTQILTARGAKESFTVGEPLQTQRGRRKRLESSGGDEAENDEEGKQLGSASPISEPVWMAGMGLGGKLAPILSPANISVLTPTATQGFFTTAQPNEGSDANQGDSQMIKNLGTGRRSSQKDSEKGAPLLSSRLPTARSQRRRNITLPCDDAEDEVLEPQLTARPIIGSTGSFQGSPRGTSPVVPAISNLPPNDASITTEEVLYSGKTSTSNKGRSSYQASEEGGKAQIFTMPQTTMESQGKDVPLLITEANKERLLQQGAMDAVASTERSQRIRTPAFSKGAPLSSRFFNPENELKLTDLSEQKEGNTLTKEKSSSVGSKGRQYVVDSSLKNEPGDGIYTGPKGASISSMGIFKKGHSNLSVGSKGQQHVVDSSLKNEPGDGMYTGPEGASISSMGIFKKGRGN